MRLARDGLNGWRLYPIKQFRELRAVWDRLNQRSGNSPVLESAFVSPLLHHFAKGDEIIAVHEGISDFNAMGIFRRRLNGVWDTFQPSQAPLGLWINEQDLSPVGLLRTLQVNLPGIALSVGIQRLDSSIHLRPSDSEMCHTLDSISTYSIPVHGKFDDYWLLCSKNLRKNLRRQFNKLARLGVNVRLEQVTQEFEIGSVLREYGGLESSGWKGQAGTAVHPDNVQGRFYREALEVFCSTKRCVVFQYKFDDRVVAMDLCIVSNGVLINLKSAYDESIKSMSPSMLMLHDYLKLAFDQGAASRIEFLGPEMEWNTQWAGESRKLYHINHHRWPWISSVIRAPVMSVIRRRIATRAG